MGIPETIFEIIDKSEIIPVFKKNEYPIFMQVFSSDKGPEDFRRVDRNAFFKLYGDVSFKKHGQPLLQAANIVNNGGVLLAKRVVDENATLANLALVAKVKVTKEKVEEPSAPLDKDTLKDQKEKEKQQVDSHSTASSLPAKPAAKKEEKELSPDPLKKEKENEKLPKVEGDHSEPQGEEHKEVLETVTRTVASRTEAVPPKEITKCVITYELQSTKNAKNINAIASSVNSLLNDNGDEEGVYTYPLFVISDIGRGVSNKKIKITPDYALSRYTNYIKYKISAIENDKVIESAFFTFDPDIIEKDKNISLESVINYNSTQLKCKMFEDCVDMFMAKVAKCTGKPLEEIRSIDLLFGLDKNNNKLDYLTIETDEENPVNLSYAYGINLDNGSNGNFKENPFNTDEYNKEVIKVFNGEFSPLIYDYDNNPIDLIVDANYSDEIKREIEKLVTFREDVSYFRDLGVEIESIGDIKGKLNKGAILNKFCNTYNIVYDIIDPFTKKQITVTAGYSLCRLLTEHFRNGRTRPLAGQLYNFTIPEAIEGTVKYLPKVTPEINEKRILNDLRVNYASYYDNILTVETLWTSQQNVSQLSYINNVLGIQEIIKTIRVKCPKNRYSFASGKDLESYKKDIQTTLDRFSGNFEKLTMEYVEDKAMIANKIFYASIIVKFKDFFQTEYFKIYAIN